MDKGGRGMPRPHTGHLRWGTLSAKLDWSGGWGMAFPSLLTYVLYSLSK